MKREIHLTEQFVRVECGPAMSRLRTDRQRAFVMAFNNSGMDNAAAAARAAGYAEGSARVTACLLLTHEDIKAAILEDQRARLLSMGPSAMDVVQEIMNTPGEKDRLKAALAVLNRTGHAIVNEKNINLNVNLADDEKIARIKTLADKMGLDAKKLLGNTVDAEFKDVTPEKPFVMPAELDGLV